MLTKHWSNVQFILVHQSLNSYATCIWLFTNTNIRGSKVTSLHLSLSMCCLYMLLTWWILHQLYLFFLLRLFSLPCSTEEPRDSYSPCAIVVLAAAATELLVFSAVLLVDFSTQPWPTIGSNHSTSVSLACCVGENPISLVQWWGKQELSHIEVFAWDKSKWCWCQPPICDILPHGYWLNPTSLSYN